MSFRKVLCYNDGTRKIVPIFVPIGNKCFRLVIKEGDDGLTWEQAKTECRKGPGYFPDLASVHSDKESGK